MKYYINPDIPKSCSANNLAASFALFTAGAGAGASLDSKIVS